MSEPTQICESATDCGAAHVLKVVWHGDLTDDCWAKAGNLLAHCERLGTIRWCDEDEKRTKHKSEYWHVSVGLVNGENFSVGDDIFNSGEPGGLILGGTMARAIAEAILKAPGEPSGP